MSIFSADDHEYDLEFLEKENNKLKEEVRRLKEVVRAGDNMICELGAIHEAMVDALKGVEPSDFMLSFPEVRMAWDLLQEAVDWRDAEMERIRQSWEER